MISMPRRTHAKVRGWQLWLLLLSFLSLCQTPQGLCSEAYDPLLLPPEAMPAPIDDTIHDATRHRDIPIRIYAPSPTSPPRLHPVVLFSHGLGGSREGSPFLGNHWAARGYVVVFMQHPGSDESIWKGKPLLQRVPDLKSAASSEQFLARNQDVKQVLNALEQWNQQPQHPLLGRLDLHKVGMSGHSFGAVTTQAVSGESFGTFGRIYTDERILAAIAFSPSPPRAGSADKAFGSVQIPWMLMTGTLDRSPIGNCEPSDRLKVYPALGTRSKYELVLDGAEHSVFTEGRLRGEHAQRNPNHHRVILALSTAFWDTYLLADPKAKQWVQNAGPRSCLESKDRWQWCADGRSSTSTP